MSITSEEPASPLYAERSRPTYLWVPAGFNPCDYLEEPLHNRADLARFVVHKIIWSNVFKLHDKHGFVPLKAEYLRRFFPGSASYAGVMKSLVESGAIACDGMYVQGSKSLGYKLGSALAGQRHRRVIVDDRTLARKIARSRDDYVGALRGVYRHLYDHLTNAQIDSEPAMESLLGEGFEPTNETAVQLIRDRQFFLHVCPYGRVHTNLTNLKSTLRRYLSVHGQKLVNLDIRNSQPLVFASILKSHYEFDATQQEEAAPPDVLQYVDLVQAGKLYDSLMEESGITPDQRSSFKKCFFARVFYCKNDPTSDEARLFGNRFPSVYALVRSMKAEAHADLAKSLQRAESAIMIGGVASRCMREIPHAFISTIHDSVLTTLRYADAIRTILSDEFLKVGLIPTIQVESA